MTQPSVSSTGEGIAEAAELACNVKLLLDGEAELGSPQPARVRGGPQGPARRRPGDLERRSGARERPLVPGVRRSAGSSPSSCAPGAPTGWTAAGCWPRSASNASTSPPTVASTNGWWHGPPSRSTGCAGGYGGPGTQTVLPNEAVAKCDVRLVPDQRTSDVLAKLEAHFARHAPGVELVRGGHM